MPLKTNERPSVDVLRDENQAPGVTVNVLASNNHNKVRRIGWKGRAAMVGALLVGGVIVDAFIPHGKSTKTSIEKAVVTQVYESTLNTRAIAIGEVEGKARMEPGNDAGDRFIDHIWGLGWLNEKFNGTFGMTATFTGPNGKGGGRLATFVDVPSQAEVILPPTGKNKVVVDIFANQAVLVTGVDEAKSEVIDNNGDGASIGSTVVKLIPGTQSLQLSAENTQGQLNQDAIIASVNEMQTRCIPSAMHLIDSAITASEDTVVLKDNKIERQYGEDVLPIKRKDIIVHIYGTPATPDAYNPYATNEQLNLTGSVGGDCRVAPHALITQDGYANAHLDPLSN